MEERLSGGRNEGAVRVDDTVRRRAGSRTVAVHALLRHLHAHGFTRVPEPLGLDEQGREVTTFLPGQTVGEARPWPAWAHSETTLVAVGHWLHDFHEASLSFVPPAGAHWFGDHDELRPGEIIGHHDAAPYNAVWQPTPTTEDPDAGDLVGFIDWELAGPASPLRDLAFTALTWVPLTTHDVAATDGFPAGIDRGRRLRLLLEAYGWSEGPEAVLAAVRQRASEHAASLHRGAANGYAPAIALVAEGVADDFDRAVVELDAETPTLLEAFQ